MTPAPSTPLFTAAQIARALGKSKRAVWRLLEGVSASSRVPVKGNEAEAWTVAALPDALKTRLHDEAKRRGYRDTAHLLNSPPKRLELRDEHGRPLSLSDIADVAVSKAVQLQKAMAPSLVRMNDMRLSPSEFERLGVEDYRKVFGHIITTRHWRDLFKRTVDRDGGAEDWERTEIYLENKPARKVAALPVFSAAAGAEFRELRDVIASFRDPLAPSSAEEALLWLRAFELYEAQRSAAKAPKKLKRRLLSFLWRHAPRLAKTENALRVSFERKLSAWIGKERDPAALVDGREQRRGLPAVEPIAPQSVDRIVYHAVANCGGRVAQAVRELTDLDELDPDLQAWFAKKFASKSYVPHRLRDAVQDQVRALMPHHQGPRAAEKTIPPLELNYSGIRSMKAVSIDDLTPPIKMRVPNGKGWWRTTRGQAIMVIDFVTLCILSSAVQEEEQPNSLLARTALVSAFREHGLPEIINLERGQIFADAKLITGGAESRKHRRGEVGACSDAEIEMGLRQFGIKIIVSRRARSKPIERVFGMLQDLMHGEPGYCGRKERYDCPEETTYWEKELDRGNPKALDHFYTIEQLEARLWELCERYNRTPHDARAKRNPGVSPLQQFQALWPHDDPPSKLPPEIDFLLAHHKIENVEIKDSGIWIRNRGEVFRYFDEQTGQRRLKDRFVMAFFNPEAPERCTFTDSKMRDAFTVERHQSVNALEPDANFATESAKAHAHMSASSRRYRALKAQSWATFRHSVVLTPKTVELGKEIQEAGARAETQRRKIETRQRTVRSRAEKLGLPPSLVSHGSAHEDEGTRLMQEAEREHNGSSDSVAKGTEL